MVVFYLLLIVLFCCPSVVSLVRAMRSTEQKPAKTEVAGIIFCTAVMAVFLAWLMYENYFF